MKSQDFEKNMQRILSESKNSHNILDSDFWLLNDSTFMLMLLDHDINNGKINPFTMKSDESIRLLKRNTIINYVTAVEHGLKKIIIDHIDKNSLPINDLLKKDNIKMDIKNVDFLFESFNNKISKGSLITEFFNFQNENDVEKVFTFCNNNSGFFSQINGKFRNNKNDPNSMAPVEELLETYHYDTKAILNNLFNLRHKCVHSHPIEELDKLPVKSILSIGFFLSQFLLYSSVIFLFPL